MFEKYSLLKKPFLGRRSQAKKKRKKKVENKQKYKIQPDLLKDPRNVLSQIRLKRT